MKTKYFWIGAVTLIIILVMIYNAISTPGISDLRGNFKEVAFARNEQNTGPVIRVYAVIVDLPGLDQIEQYGNYMPHTKYGKTTVYFFNRNGEYPQNFTATYELPEKYRAMCIAVYEKDGMGQVVIKKDPYESYE